MPLWNQAVWNSGTLWWGRLTRLQFYDNAAHSGDFTEVQSITVSPCCLRRWQGQDRAGPGLWGGEMRAGCAAAKRMP